MRIKRWIWLGENFALGRCDRWNVFNLLVWHHLVVIHFELVATLAVIVLILDYWVWAAPVRIDLPGKLTGLGLVGLVALAVAHEEHATNVVWRILRLSWCADFDRAIEVYLRLAASLIRSQRLMFLLGAVKLLLSLYRDSGWVHVRCWGCHWAIFVRGNFDLLGPIVL